MAELAPSLLVVGFVGWGRGGWNPGLGGCWESISGPEVFFWFLSFVCLFGVCVLWVLGFDLV